MEALRYLKIGMASGQAEAYAEMILANGDARIRVEGRLGQQRFMQK